MSQVTTSYTSLGWRQILELVTCWSGKQSPGDIITSTGLSYWTIQRWLERLRDRLPLDEAKLSGLVEIDQSWPGRQKHGPGSEHARNRTRHRSGPYLPH